MGEFKEPDCYVLTIVSNGRQLSSIFPDKETAEKYIEICMKYVDFQSTTQLILREAFTIKTEVKG